MRRRTRVGLALATLAAGAVGLLFGVGVIHRAGKDKCPSGNSPVGLAAVCPAPSTGPGGGGGGGDKGRGGSGGRRGGNKGTGGSDAVCSPTACSDPTSSTEFSVSAPDTYAADTHHVRQDYWIVKPVNLVCSARAPCPMVVHSGCPPAAADPSSTCMGLRDSSNWSTQADTDKYVLMYLPPTHECASVCVYGTPTYDPDPRAGPNLCGTGGRSPCDDVPYVKAALDATICSRRSPCQDVDPDKVFVTGESKGAGMATNLICDTRTSTYFRGASIVSESYPLRSPAGTGLSGQATAPNCPALGGSSNGVGGPPSLNTDISIQWQYGDSDSVGCNIGLPETCYDTGGVTNATDGTHWVWSIPQLAGDNTPPTGQGATSAGTDVTPGHALGCPTAPTSTSHPSTHVFIDTYAGCTVSIRATETVKAVGGGHACPGLANLDSSYDCAATGWSFLMSH